MSAVSAVRSSSRIVSMCALLACVGGAAGSAADTDTRARDAALARPISSAALALLLPYVDDPSAQARIAFALKDSRSEVRAVAARVIFVSALSAHVPALASALEAEQSPEAAIEELRALADLGGGAHTDIMDAAATRLGEPVAVAYAEILARTQPGALVDRLPGWIAAGRGGFNASGAWASVYTRATKGDPALAARLSALTTSNQALWTAILERARDEAKRREDDRSKALARDKDEPIRSVRTLTDIPAAIFVDVLAAAGCKNPRESSDVLAQVTYQPSGRARHVGLSERRVSMSCANALRAVVPLTILQSPPEDPSTNVDLIVPFPTRRLMTCAAEARDDPMPVELLDLKGLPDAKDASLASALHRRARPPVVKREVRPQYTRYAMDERLQGAAWIAARVTRRGCVAEARVVRSLHPSLDAEALRAVVQWEFAPGLMDDRPVPVLIAVEVTFTMRR